MTLTFLLTRFLPEWTWKLAAFWRRKIGSLTPVSYTRNRFIVSASQVVLDTLFPEMGLSICTFFRLKNNHHFQKSGRFNSILLSPSCFLQTFVEDAQKKSSEFSVDSFNSETPGICPRKLAVSSLRLGFGRTEKSSENNCMAWMIFPMPLNSASPSKINSPQNMFFFCFWVDAFWKKKTSKNPTSFWTPNVQLKLSSQRLSLQLARWLRWILASRCHIAWAFASWMMKVVSLRSPGVGEDVTLEGIWPTIEVEETNCFCGKKWRKPVF